MEELAEMGEIAEMWSGSAGNGPYTGNVRTGGNDGKDGNGG